MSGGGGLSYDRYQVNGRDEWRMRIGPDDGVPILFLPPLFEEMNRTRALLAQVMRVLGSRGFRCTLPDLPGTGESERALETCGWEDWVDAARAADNPALVASFRGGVLLDEVGARAWWRFAPVSGASLMRDLQRAESAGSGASSPTTEWFAGYRVPVALTDALRMAEPADVAPCRTVRLTSDPKPRDAKLEGPALWRRSEPASSSELTAAVADDIAEWARRCDIC